MIVDTCPPDSNTGGKLTGLLSRLSTPSNERQRYACEIGLDWIQGSTRFENLYRVRKLLSSFGANFCEADVGRWGYVSCEMSPNGCFIAYTAERPEFAFCIPGKVLAQLDAAGMLRLWNELNVIGFKATRLDIRFDDYARTVSPREVFDAAKRGDLAHYRVCQWMESSKGGELAGETCYLGRPGQQGGGRCYCIYDKLLESGDKSLDCVRWELRLYGERAELARLFLAGSADSAGFISRLGELVGGNASFVDRSDGETHLSRCKVLSWWQVILDRIGSVVIRPRRICPTLSDTMRAIKDQYGSALAAIQQALTALGGNFHEFISDVLNDGVTRMRRSHHTRVDEFVRKFNKEVSDGSETSDSECADVGR